MKAFHFLRWKYLLILKIFTYWNAPKIPSSVISDWFMFSAFHPSQDAVKMRENILVLNLPTYYMHACLLFRLKIAAKSLQRIKKDIQN